MDGPISPPPVKGGAGDELPAYMSNGVVGLKIRDNPLTPGMTLCRSALTVRTVEHNTLAVALLLLPRMMKPQDWQMRISKELSGCPKL